ncbi:MAG: alpha-1,2-fucosyltransferase [Desulfomonile tiedjei]|nr:alpha-1,2-fucosyltransferase [Desulfomonile tiedjei]
MNKRRKVIVRLMGGLGNQLFCYAAARRLALVNDAELVIEDVSGFAWDFLYRRRYALDQFNITARKATPAERFEPFARYRRYITKMIARQRPFLKRKYLQQEDIAFDPRLLDYRVKGTVYLDGLWQSERYFKDVEDVIREDLRIVPPQDKANQAMAERIRTSNAVSVHVRWFEKPQQGQGGSEYNLESDYYSRAVQWIKARVDDPHFFLFSDDPHAARLLLKLPESLITCVDHNRGAESAYADLWLMTQCKHFIIANSTFSWWGAWLGKFPEAVVIAPALSIEGIAAWGFEGLMPSRWIVLQ